MAGFNPKGWVEEKKGVLEKDVSSGDVTKAYKTPIQQLGKDISTSSKAAGGSIKTATNKNIGDPAAKAYHTSIVDPAKNLGKVAKEWWKKEKKNLGGGGKGGYDFDPSSILNAGKGGGGGGLPGGGGGPAKQVSIGALTPDQQKLMASNEFRTDQGQLIQALQAQAAGQGPSLAAEQLRQGQQANVAAQMAALASARGGANPAMARQTMQSAQQIQAQTARDAALARIQEQMNAQQQLGGVLQQARTGDIQTAEQAQNLAIQQANLGQQYQDLKAKYTAMGIDQQRADQYAAIETERLRQSAMGIPQQPNQMQQWAGVIAPIIQAMV